MYDYSRFIDAATVVREALRIASGETDVAHVKDKNPSKSFHGAMLLEWRVCF